MTATYQTDQRTERQGEQFTADLTMRIPENDEGSLAHSATQRLETQSGLDAAEIVTLQGLDPGLSATTIQFECHLQATKQETAQRIKGLLEDAPGTETVDRVEHG